MPRGVLWNSSGFMDPRHGYACGTCRQWIAHAVAEAFRHIHAELQIATGSNRTSAKFYGIDFKTVAKWRTHFGAQ